MVETVIIKRKEFEIIERLGNRSFKVSRKGKTYFLKNYEGDKDGFDRFVRNQHRFFTSAVPTPKVYLYDKSALIAVVDFIEGESVTETLIKGDLPESYYEEIFRLDFYARNDKMLLDFEPCNFIFDGKKLVYLPYRFATYKQEEAFATNEVKLWFYSKAFANYLKGRNLPVDESRIGNEYAVNKEIALTVCKYYL